MALHLDYAILNIKQNNIILRKKKPSKYGCAKHSSILSLLLGLKVSILLSKSNAIGLAFG